MTKVFIYAKEGMVKALSLDDALIKGDNFISQGWKHTATLDVCVWIEFLLNLSDTVDVVDEFYQLTGRALNS